ncbi:traf3-interacting protein 1 [Plakobranchus ocellatus]|uniref:TRAF3-interacting protein 1 n=1 Tax=Plakobranchus ocellatus TaxID=259542 RepID=A0AAV3ZDX6_9GAST|nr:traf3-interacting protein 1 [Plakobranchus ocellatus]
MDPKVVKKTQDTLGKLIKKPPLTEKLLGKPPFRFLHDVMTSVIKTTGFMQGLYSDTEMNSENVKDKDAKIAFLQKAIDMVGAVTGKSLSVKPVKIVAGHEPERTNEFLQLLAEAINKNVDNDEYVRQVLKGSGGGGGGSAKEERRESHRDREKEKDKDRDRTKSADRRKQRESEKEKHEKDKDGERSRDKGERERSRDKGERDKDREKDRDKDRERRHDKDRDRHKDRDSKTRERSRDGREDRHKEKSRKHQKSPKAQTISPQKQAGEGTKEAPQSLYSSAEKDGSAGEELPEPSCPVVVAKAGEGGTRQPVANLHKHRNTLASSLPVGVCRRPGAKLPPPPLASHAESLATGDHSFIGLSDHREKENESPDREKMDGEKVEKQEAPSRLQRPSSAKGSRRRREGKNIEEYTIATS